MTKRVVLLRHAKAERPARIADFDRPLTARGYADAGAAGAWLAHGGHLPSVVICSPARRTRQTWHGVALAMAEAPAATVGGEAGGGPVVSYEPDVYEGDARELLDLIRKVDPAAGVVLLIGHNPSISGLSRLLDPVSADPDGLRTSGISVHRLAVPEWAELRPSRGPVEAAHTARS
ncbi:SixA phosphatase family protein [Micromonospora sp. NBC_01796]|uniref:SixA phosphatase family protein n=1 Tax=Micromonospora sp. NBC_01796 TaxID=2975987 RepID=UPI002DD8A09E|nr:histidine phosphatase family protein [Micromonospora sp. NBC_01796]WSA88678.1 histidine phosphatase family protein [Micromonospora sp. NBC_01796]